MPPAIARRTRCKPSARAFRNAAAVMCCSRLHSPGASRHEDAPASMEGDRQEGPCDAAANVTEHVSSANPPFAVNHHRTISRYPGGPTRLPGMARSALADAFARLPTSDSRLEALEALMSALSPYEWRFVQSLAIARTFQFDIIGRLPVEIVSHIFSYLDTSTPWRLQQVSRRWHRNLRSLAVLKPSLDNWYNGTVNLQGVDLDFCWRKARSIHAFRSASLTALPDSSFKISAQFATSEQVLSGDHLIWLSRDRRQVHVLNLRSLTSKTIVPIARELLRTVFASEELVMVTADAGGVIYVDELAGQGPVKRFRFVTSSRNFAVTCRNRTVACTGLLHDSILVYIWNYDTQQGKSFTIGKDTRLLPGVRLHLPTPACELGLLLQPVSETVVLCLFVRSQSQTDMIIESPQLLYYRFTYSGECLHGAKQPLAFHGAGNPTEFGDRKSMKFVPANHDGLFMLQCNSWTFGSAVKSIFTLQFDERLHTFTSPRHPRLHPIDMHDQGNVVWWKDTFIEAGTTGHIVIHRGNICDPCEETILAYEPSSFVQRSPREQQTTSKELLVNDRYMVRPYCDALYVYCYDHTVHLPGKEGILKGVGPWEIIEPRFASVSDCVRAMYA
ncbi:hypothetical protein C7974DRAFT_402211 [Boeremia exigua]|uniref:uncharacterized protein n=1 Tax=Boeremia exigua TaxID=749465 RepID=UPI001E8CC450|nr:uncharacterized protein C7974DRAFT_402211 [Boeremia exigua]KAH6616664.1 hypothetical protein C7974DRAFT_402211 [Boeremia exigua]